MFARLLQHQQAEILQAWQAPLAAAAAARSLDGAQREGALPQLLAALVAAAAAPPAAAAAEALVGPACAHALARLRHGFGLDEVVEELGAMRRSIAALTVDTGDAAAARAAFEAAIDAAQLAAVRAFTEERQRALEALEQAAAASAPAPGDGIGGLLRRLLEIFVGAAPLVGAAAVLTADGDALRLRAAVGSGSGSGGGAPAPLARPAGLLGRVLAAGRPLGAAGAEEPALSGADGPLRGSRALYAVPLVHAGRVLGVACMGSAGAAELAAEDRHLFGILVARAAAIIDEQQLRDALELERSRLVAVLEQMPSAVWVAEAPSGKIVFANRQASHAFPEVAALPADIAGYAAFTGSMHGHPIDPAAWPLARSVRGETVPNTEVEVTRIDGSVLTLLTQATPLRDRNGTVVGATSVANDISERKGLAAQLIRAVQARDDILAVVSHDLRTPVSAISLRAANMERRARRDKAHVDERLIRDAQFLEAAAGRIDRLISDLMDFASLQGGRLSIKPQVTAPEALLQDAYGTVELQAAHKKLALRCDASPCDRQIRCDRDRIAQVFSHLLGNALKVTPAGGSITLRARPRQQDMLFEVEDTGPGIAADDLPHLFERYWRADGAQYKGTGLGLSIAEGLVSAHGGRIWAESAPGRGASFCFTLPFC